MPPFACLLATCSSSLGRVEVHKKVERQTWHMIESAAALSLRREPGCLERRGGGEAVRERKRRRRCLDNDGLQKTNSSTSLSLFLFVLPLPALAAFAAFLALEIADFCAFPPPIADAVKREKKGESVEKETVQWKNLRRRADEDKK